jgi:hypothetical protein
MANYDAPRGFEPINLRDEHVHRYYKSAAVALGKGDPVVRVANSTDPQGYGMITRATTGAAITGVVVGVEPKSTRTTPYLASGDTGYVLVADWPEQEFRVQDNGGATGIALADIGNHIDSVAAINCNTTTGQSNYEIDTEAKAADNTWIIVRKDDEPGNDIGANCKWIVKPNLHTEANASATNVSEI